MNPDLSNAKAAAREPLRAALRQLSEADAARDSALIRERLLTQPRWRDASVVLLFAPIQREPNIWPLVEDALGTGKTVALPRLAADGTYRAAQLVDWATDLRVGQFGIREPRQECPEVSLNRLDFALVPGVGFTLDGGRLGRGQGYFDRLLSDVPGFKCGVGYECQIVRELPLEPRDIRLNCILTPTRWHLT